MMDFERKYNELAEAVRAVVEGNPGLCDMNKRLGRVRDLLPEKKSEDERIRKALITHISIYEGDFTTVGVTRKEMLAWLEKQKEQKPIEDVVKEITKNKEAATKFLKSAGIMNDNGELAKMYRSEQKPAEWSEEDEKMLLNILGTYETLEDMLNLSTGQDRDILESMNFERDWLKDRFKSLRHRPHWKPSEEQMEALKYFIGPSPYGYIIGALYEDLKKL